MNSTYDINGPYGPYGSIAVDPINTLKCPIYPSYPVPVMSTCQYPCQPSIPCSYLSLTLPEFLSSNIALDTNVNISIQTIILVVIYNRTGELPTGPGYLLRNQGESEATEPNSSNTKSMDIKIDSHQVNGETFPPIDLVLTQNDTIKTISYYVTGNNGILLNVVIVYTSKQYCEEELLPGGVQFRQRLWFTVVSISISYT